MISHREFHRLRLSQFFPDETVVKLENWEFMNRVWIGEAIGFSEWLCPEDQPNQLQSLALDVLELPSEGCNEVLRALDLRIRAGVSVDQIYTVLGTPRDTYEFVPDRKSYEFDYGDGDKYLVSCTVRNEGGLSYLVVMTVDDT